MDCPGTHGLCCRHSKGRHHRHASVNSIIHRALATAKIPSRLEPAGLSKSDGKRTEGATLVPQAQRQLLVWNVTCPDTLAPSNRCQASSAAGKVASAAEEKRLESIQCLDRHTVLCL